MGELEHALALTGGIYDAALDPALWPEALHGVAEFVGAVASALVSESVIARKGSSISLGGSIRASSGAISTSTST
jgi:hypothetical protein